MTQAILMMMSIESREITCLRWLPIFKQKKETNALLAERRLKHKQNEFENYLDAAAFSTFASIMSKSLRER